MRPDFASQSSAAAWRAYRLSKARLKRVSSRPVWSAVACGLWSRAKSASPGFEPCVAYPPSELPTREMVRRLSPRRAASVTSCSTSAASRRPPAATPSRVRPSLAEAECTSTWLGSGLGLRLGLGLGLEAGATGRQHGHVDGGAVEAVLQHDELRRRDERRWRQAEQAQQHAWSPRRSPRGARARLASLPPTRRLPEQVSAASVCSEGTGSQTCAPLPLLHETSCRSIFLTESSTPRRGRRVLAVALGRHHKSFGSAGTARGRRALDLVGALHALWRAVYRRGRENAPAHITLGRAHISGECPCSGEDSVSPVERQPFTAGGFDACGARVLPGRLSGAVEHAGGASRVSFDDPDRRLFRAPHGVLCAKVRGALRPDRGHGGHVRSSPTQRVCDGVPGSRRAPGGHLGYRWTNGPVTNLPGREPRGATR
eukprot:scaffold37316_cov65-Phaeocystis_antarctica.AAC.1